MSGIIVTGGAGFIGCNMARALNARGMRDLTIVDHLNHDGKRRNLAATEHVRYLDRDEFRGLLRRRAIEKPEAVIHLGACSSTTETDEAYLTDNNVTYTRELCEWCLETGSRFVYASSAATYGDGSDGYSDRHADIARLRPLNPYGRSKQQFDVWALERGLLDRIAGVKYFNVYGPREDHKGEMRSMVNKAHAEVLKTGELTLFRSHRPDYRDGEQKRDFVHVRDAVAVTLFLLDHPRVNGIFNCGTGRARTWLDVAHALFDAMGVPPRIRFTDMPEGIRDRYQYHTEADMTKLRAAGFGEPFTSIENGVRDYVVTYLSNPRPRT